MFPKLHIWCYYDYSEIYHIIIQFIYNSRYTNVCIFDRDIWAERTVLYDNHNLLVIAELSMIHKGPWDDSNKRSYHGPMSAIRLEFWYSCNQGVDAQNEANKSKPIQETNFVSIHISCEITTSCIHELLRVTHVLDFVFSLK